MVLFMELHRPRMTLDIESGKGRMVRLLALSFVGLRVIVHDFHGDTVQVC